MLHTTQASLDKEKRQASLLILARCEPVSTCRTLCVRNSGTNEFIRIVKRHDTRSVSLCVARGVAHHTSLLTAQKKTGMIPVLLVRPVRLELTRSPIRPSNVRVCLFRHGRTVPLLYDSNFHLSRNFNQIVNFFLCEYIVL